MASGSTSCARYSPIPTRLTILGDGSQSKSYVHVDDVIDAVLLREQRRERAHPVVQRRDRRLHHRHGDRRPRGQSCRPRPCHRSLRVHGWRSWAGRATCRSSGCSIERMRATRLVAYALVAEALAESMRSLVERSRSGQAVTTSARGGLPRPGRRAIRAPVVDGLPARSAASQELELEDGVAEALRGASRRRLPPRGRDEPTRDRARHPDPDGGRRDPRAPRSSFSLSTSIIVCPHDDADECECRKPKPGMLLDAARAHGLALERSYMVGDRWRDVDAGRNAGCTCVFLDRKYSETMPVRPDVTVRAISVKQSPGSSRRAVDDDDRRSSGQDLRRRRRPRTRQELCSEPWIRGFTTNPTLMRSAGVDDYASFAHELLELVPDRPISFEVIADELDEIERQARLIASWGGNVFVKVPVTTTRAETMAARRRGASLRAGSS